MINIEYFEELAQGDENIKNRLLKLVHKELVSEREELEKEFSKLYDTGAERAKVLHEIKPKFKMFNMEEEFIRADEYDKQLREGQNAPETCEMIIHDIDRLLNFLEKYR